MYSLHWCEDLCKKKPKKNWSTCFTQSPNSHQQTVTYKQSPKNASSQRGTVITLCKLTELHDIATLSRQSRRVLSQLAWMRLVRGGISLQTFSEMEWNGGSWIFSQLLELTIHRTALEQRLLTFPMHQANGLLRTGPTLFNDRFLLLLWLCTVRSARLINRSPAIPVVDSKQNTQKRVFSVLHVQQVTQRSWATSHLNLFFVLFF